LYEEKLMGWNTGSEIMSGIIESLVNSVGDTDTREEIYVSLINLFEEYDCDVLFECKGEDVAFDRAYDQLYPEEEEFEMLDPFEDDNIE
jgi:hypothetical protein